MKRTVHGRCARSKLARRRWPGFKALVCDPSKWKNPEFYDDRNCPLLPNSKRKPAKGKP